MDSYIKTVNRLMMRDTQLTKVALSSVSENSKGIYAINNYLLITIWDFQREGL